MKSSLFVCLCFVFLIKYSTSTLVDGIVTLSWTATGSSPAVDRFLTNKTLLKLQVLCREITISANATKEQIRKGLKSEHKKTKISISGRIGRFVGCLPLQSDTFMTSNQLSGKDMKDVRPAMEIYYENLWREVESKTFSMKDVECGYDGYLQVEDYSELNKPEISPEEVAEKRKKSKKVRRAATEEKSPLQTAVSQQTNKQLLTWADGYYIVEISVPQLNGATLSDLDVDVVVAMINRYGGYLTADEHPAMVFYVVMTCIYAVFIVLWSVWCACYWKELLKIQFWIAGVILMGMIEKVAFVVEYDTVNRNGEKVHVAIVSAEILSCLKRTLSRMLVIIVALGYGIVKPRLGSLKQKVFGMGLLYFATASTEALLRINTKNDETNNRVMISRIPLAVIDATIYYWIFTGLVATTRTLRLRKNIVKLNVYRHFTNTMIFAIVASLLFMIWSLKSHFFTTCITNWREFWVDDAFWHILFSFILLVIMFLFRPSNNNQRYAFVPLLDPSDNEEDDEDDEEKGESAVFDSITMRKASSAENGSAAKNKKQQQSNLNREANVSGSGNNGAVEDALTWVEENIPTTIADQALQALDSDEEVINTKLERSKMQ